MCFTVQLSMFFAVSDSFDILSCCFDFVKNFFNFLSRSFLFFFDSVASNFDIISQVLFDVNNFLSFFKNLFCCCSLEQNSFIISSLSSFVNNFSIFSGISLLTLYIYKIPIFPSAFCSFFFLTVSFTQTPPVTSFIDFCYAYPTFNVPYNFPFLSAFSIQDILYLLYLQFITKNPAHTLSAHTTSFKCTYPTVQI